MRFAIKLLNFVRARNGWKQIARKPVVKINTTFVLIGRKKVIASEM